MLEIGTGEAVSVISNLGQETHAPGSLISNVRNWPFFRFATCGGHKTATKRRSCSHMRHVRPIICTLYPSTHMHCTVAIVHVPLVVLHCALAVSFGVITDISVLACVVAAYLGRTSSYENNDHGVDQRKQQRYLFNFFSRASRRAVSLISKIL